MAKVPKTAVTGDRSRFYARLLVHRRRQWTLGILVAFFTVIFAVMIAQNMLADKPWMAVGMPIGCLGLLFLLFPQTEEWEYKPWQAKAVQYESHTLY
jgi:hypothetical protein